MPRKKTTPSLPDADELTRLSRRDFLGVVLGTLPVAALPGGALAELWPETERDREVDEPWVLALDNQTLWDPADDKPLRVPLELGTETDTLEFQDWYGWELKCQAWTTWRELPKEVQERFNVYLVEGDQPGSDATYIRYAGKLDDLNQQLAAAGLNIVVIEQGPSYDLLFPGDPGY